MKKTEPYLMKIQETMQFLNVSRETLWRLTKQDADLQKCLRHIGKQKYYVKHLLEDYINSKTHFPIDRPDPRAKKRAQAEGEATNE